MQFLKSSIACAALLLAVLSVSEAGMVIPPLYRENPNARLDLSGRAAEPNYRLPNNTEPVAYDIELHTNVHTGERAFTGTVKIELIATEATRNVTLHTRQITDFVANIASKGTPMTAIPMKWKLDDEREFLILEPVDEAIVMPKDSEWILTISYKGELRTDNGGFYLSTYTDDTGKERFLATTQFESTDARHAFPCYDEPAKRAIFTITIHHSPEYSAISNMPVDATKSKQGVTVFQPTLKMPTYIIAFIVSDFKYTEGVLNGLPQRIYSRPGSEHDQEWALVSGMLITERLGEYYHIKFPLPKLDQAAIPDFAAGAMENWGLATYREEYLLYNTQKSTVNTQTNIANIIAHEYTHMWFGDYVTIRWWTYLWLKEGFATLFSYQAADEAYPEWGIWQMFHTGEYQIALASDAAEYSRPMTHYVQKPNDISRLYDSISYSKAGSVLSMFQHALTDEVFRLGLNKYLTLRGLDSGVEEDLFYSIQAAAKELNHRIEAEIDDMMGSWSRHGGYPMLTVTRNYNDGSFTVKQEQYFNNKDLNSTYKWYVPFNYMDNTNWDFRNTVATHFMKNTEAEIKVNAKIERNDWLLLNKQSTGYFRVNYDDENWNLIIDGLIEKPYKFHPRNRAQLLHDAYNFMSSNRLNHNTLLSMMLYLKNEDQYAPWSTANSIIVTFNRYLSVDAEYADFKEFIAELVNGIYEKLGVNDMPGEQHFQKYTRNIAINLACLAGIESCLIETNNKLKDSMDNKAEIEPNLQLPTYCNGLKQAEDKEFNYVYDKLMTSADQAQRRLLISALGCAQKADQIKKFISSSTDMANSLRTQERTTLLSSAYSRGEVGLLTSMEFLDENWEDYINLTPGFGGQNPLEADLQGMSRYVVNDQQQQKLMALVNKVKDNDKISNNLEGTVNSTITANMNWVQQNRDPIFGWIRRYRNSSASISASILSVALALFVTMSRYF